MIEPAFEYTYDPRGPNSLASKKTSCESFLFQIPGKLSDPTFKQKSWTRKLLGEMRILRVL